MSSSANGLPQRRQSMSKPANEDDSGLTQSLSQLSLTKEPASANQSRRASTSNPVKAPSRRSSTSAAAVPRRPSRSPSNGPDSRAVRGATPPLRKRASANSLHSANGTGAVRPISRRSSSGQVLSPSFKTPFGEPTPEEEIPPPVTAHSVANDYFEAELEALHGPNSLRPTDTIVILNDAVYGHRFSRPRTSRNALSTIVERPERIKAGVLGISAAYVRLGGRHNEGALPIHPARDVNGVQDIPFRIHKTTRRLPITSQAVTNVHGTKWMEELKLMCESAESILAMGGKELQRPDIPRGPGDPAPQKLHEGDLYLCSESLNAVEGALGAVCEAVDTVFAPGPRRAFVGVRPPGHHCSASHPSGFCWVNNVLVGIMHGVLEHNLTHAAIIDFDLHHGDGSQAIVWQHNARANVASKNHAPWKRSSIGYFSLHDINSYPCEMGDEEKVKNASLCIDNAHGQNIWNVHLQSWKTEQDFWALYESKYKVLLDKTRSYLRTQSEKLRAANQAPVAAIFFSAGFDASEWESAGMQRHQVNVPTEFYARLAQDVVQMASEEGLGVDGRVISVLEGGYSDRALFSGVLSHLSGLAGGELKPVNGDHEMKQEPNGYATEMDQGIGSLNPGGGEIGRGVEAQPYDPAWWASAELDKLESPVMPPSPPRKPRTSTPPTYSSPTQASTARVSDPVRMRQSLSGLSLSSTKVIPRQPTPPPPEVSWVVAAQALSKVLIPSHRQTDSCKAEELNAEASRARRERQSNLLGLPPTPTTADRPPSRSLRDRKSRIVPSIEEEASEVLPKTRRKAAGTPSSSPIKVTRGTPSGSVPPSARRTSRRLSGTSVSMSPPRETPPPVPPIPASAAASSRPSSRSGRAQSRDRGTAKKKQAASTRKEPVARPPRSTRKASTPARAAKQATVGADTPTPANGLPATVGHDAAAGDVDNVSSGVKKIKINLITNSQKKAREEAKKEEAKTIKVEPIDEGGSSIIKTEKPPTPEGMSSIPKTTEVTSSTQIASSSNEPQTLAPQAPPTPSLSAGLSTPVEELYPSGQLSPTPARFTVTGSSPDAPRPGVEPAGDGSEFFIPYQPEGPEPEAVTMTQQEPLKWLPPNIPTPSAATPATTPSPVKKTSGLFHYTSGIPFAPRPQQPGTEKSLEGQKPELKATAHSLWDADPKTPQK